MDLSTLNVLAIGAAALVTFLVGGVWYSPMLFGKAWAELNGLTEDDLKQGNPAKVFGGSFLLALLMAFNLAAFIGPYASLGFAAFAGFLAGFGWVAAAMGVTALFERKPLKLWLINAGYHVVSFTLMGLILGAWKA
ncbi:MAG: DUF1761 domain-containing protein [Sandaracinaceae bacterium]